MYLLIMYVFIHLFIYIDPSCILLSIFILRPKERYLMCRGFCHTFYSVLSCYIETGYPDMFYVIFFSSYRQMQG
jgi:hypothetical protein